MPSENFPRHLLQRPGNERLAYFRSYTVAHPKLTEASDALLRSIREPAGRSLILVLGPTGVGKTTLRFRIEHELKREFLALDKPAAGRIPVVGLEAVAPDCGNFSWKDYYRRALRVLEEPLIDNKINYATPSVRRSPSGELIVNDRAGSHELRRAMEHALYHRRPAAVLIDEAQHLTKMASGRRLSDQLDCLKSLASLTGCIHVLVGTYELLPCRNLSAQLSRRSIDIHFSRYRADDPDDILAFQRVVFSFQRHLPLAQEPELWREWEYCYVKSIGCVGILKDWFTRALAEAIERNASTLTRADLERHAWSADQCERMAKDALEGEAVLAHKPDAVVHLKRLLGLDTPKVQASTSEKPPQISAIEGAKWNQGNRRVRVGSRRPVRDVVGIC